MLTNSYREVYGQILKPFFTKMIFHNVEYEALLYGEAKVSFSENTYSEIRNFLKEEGIDLSSTEIRKEIKGPYFAVGFKSQEEASFLKLCLPDTFSSKIIISPTIAEINDAINLLMFPGGKNVS